MRIAKLISVVTFVLGASSAMPQGALPEAVNLNDRSSELLLRDSDPVEYERVVRFIEMAESLSCNQRELESVRVRLEVASLACGSFLKTSYPPKRHIEFSTSSRRYTKTITLRGELGRFVP